MAVASLKNTNQAYLSSWLNMARNDLPPSSYQPSYEMPFQRWFKFKEAYAPSFVVDVIKRLPYFPKRCLDPFGGSGTTALCCQFLGIKPTTIEVNPFMADLIEAKLARYNIAHLRFLSRTVARRARRLANDVDLSGAFPSAPKTLIEPGFGDRWIFNKEVAKAIIALRDQIGTLEDENIRRLLRVLLGCNLIKHSNVVINGKGRRYRRNWQERVVTQEDIFSAFEKTCAEALTDLSCYENRATTDYLLIRGDSRSVAFDSQQVDFILTSPPYPNSFDYTDIYNVELWALGYLNSPKENTELRRSTLRSHVQIANYDAWTALKSRKLTRTYRSMVEIRSQLWNPRLPEMVCHYFQDMLAVLKSCHKVLRQGRQMVLTVGNSRYGGVLIDVPGILKEIAPQSGFSVTGTEAVRSMRSSAQQGGEQNLDESLIWLTS